MVMLSIAILSLLMWIGLLLFRGGFWRADQRLGNISCDTRTDWPNVTAIVPARNEAPTIGTTVSSLLGQSYPGNLDIIVVNDHSSDGTAEKAREAAAGSARLTVLDGKALPEGWTGKVWAMSQGVAHAEAQSAKPDYLWFTDADIEHDPEILRHLIEKAETENRVLVSLMVMLRCESIWERILIPAFIFFFQKLYPFRWVNDPTKTTAGAAGGCMVVRYAAVENGGGLNSIKGEIIDDCALGRLLKAEGAIWLGLTGSARSLRRAQSLSDIWNMVMRTAFNQLRYSPWQLGGTVVGMTLLYLCPPTAAVVGLLQKDGMMAALGIVTWGVMSLAYWPTLRLYRQSILIAPVLPIAALLYTLMTLDSARHHWFGRDPVWKGRSYSHG